MQQRETTLRKIRPLQKMFDKVPSHYDRMNRILTLRMDEYWRKKAARICLEDNPSAIADICTGTGDLACHIAKRRKSSIQVTGIDFSRPMLEAARRKAIARRLTHVDFNYGDVAELPFADETIDVISIGFGFRNLTFKNSKCDTYLSEIFRILKKGGKLVIVETNQPKYRFVRHLYHVYLKIFVNFIGGLISGNRKAYSYLAHSAIHFFTMHEVQLLLKSKGFKSVKSRPLFFGVAALHVAFK